MSTVFAYYYPWWGAPPISRDYEHWNGGNPGRWLPAENIAADFYPSLRPYDSGDSAVVGLHMSQMKAAGVDVVSLSWWGQGSREDGRTPGILNAAAAAGLKVNFMVEPYYLSQPQLSSDLAYLASSYGGHPALFALQRPTMYEKNSRLRPVVMLYAPPLAVAPVLDAARKTPSDALFLVRGNDALMLSDEGVRRALSWTHADGMFNYGCKGSLDYANQLPWSADYVAVFCAAPGFDDSRKPGVASPTVIARSEGATYDALWAQLAEQKVEFAAVCSFNEWHEGTQVEPALPCSYMRADGSVFTYQDYGSAGSNFYLSRTAYWTGLLKAV